MGLKEWLTKNIHVTSPEDPDPFFHPRRYSQPKEDVVKAALEVLASLKDWRLEEHRENQGLIRAANGRLFPPSSEDIHLYILRGTDGVTKLEMTSRSRGGRGDWGRNKRNIAKFLSRLDSRIGSLK